MPLALMERRFDRAASIAPGTTDSSGDRASMSARGTKRTYRTDLTMSVDGGRAEVGGTQSNRRD
jgi:hypothetical protein